MNIKAHRPRRKAEVNIVPMVDVLTVLIFFFLLTMQFKDIYAVDITPPNMESATGASTQKPDTIAIDKDGRYYFNAKEIKFDALKETLNSVAQKGDDASLILLADKDTPLHFVTSAIDIVKISKIKKLSLQTDK
ncbi:MAG: biopolymer transporter ExbD [Opitutales bacterium]|nr:biopolymer transporter ExbD [Opitutales bacterium]